MVQPGGTVIVPFLDEDTMSIAAFTSTNGGKNWTAAVNVAALQTYNEEVHFRSRPLPSAEIDGSGTVYVAWKDCRFESKCSANDIVFSTSWDGTYWSAVQRIPADPIGSRVDHFIAGLAVDKLTSGSSAHIAVTYYYFTGPDCRYHCQLYVGYLSSTNGGAAWSAGQPLAGPMHVKWLANTNQGRMVGDYISTSIASNGLAYPVFAVATQNKGMHFNEAIFTIMGGLPVAGGTCSIHSIVIAISCTPLTAYCINTVRVSLLIHFLTLGLTPGAGGQSDELLRVGSIYQIEMFL